MKVFTRLTIIFLLTASFAFRTVDDVIVAIKNGDANQISRYFDKTVEITLPDKSNSYSKSQAELVLRDFFSTNIVKDFLIIHKGDNSGSEYCIGTLETKNGSFRTTIFLKQKDNKQLLQELHFEK